MAFLREQVESYVEPEKLISGKTYNIYDVKSAALTPSLLGTFKFMANNPVNNLPRFIINDELKILQDYDGSNYKFKLVGGQRRRRSRSKGSRRSKRSRRVKGRRNTYRKK